MTSMRGAMMRCVPTSSTTIVWNQDRSGTPSRGRPKIVGCSVRAQTLVERTCMGVHRAHAVKFPSSARDRLVVRPPPLKGFARHEIGDVDFNRQVCVAHALQETL